MSLPRPSGPSKALKLGARGKEVDNFVDKLKSEGETIMPTMGKRGSDATKVLPTPVNVERYRNTTTALRNRFKFTSETAYSSVGTTLFLDREMKRCTNVRWFDCLERHFQNDQYRAPQITKMDISD